MNCRICHGPARASYTLRSQRYGSPVRTRYCPACDAFFSDGSPTNYEDVDLGDYYNGHAVTIKTRYMRFCEFVGAMQSPGRFLDIGAGMGFSLDVAVEHGWQATGIEPNRHLAAHARSRGVNVENRFLDASFTGGFDLILLDNVLEHVPDPANFLGHASRLLAQRGVMVIAVPPLDWLRKALARSSYVRDQVQAPQLNVFCEVDEHLSMFTRQAMQSLLQGVGLQPLAVRFHHSRAYANAAARVLGIDDGYHFAVRPRVT